MATTGKRTVHFKGGGPLIHWMGYEYRPSGETKMEVGERLVVTECNGFIQVSAGVLVESWFLGVRPGVTS